jgi:putative ABC transport system permease protein
MEILPIFVSLRKHKIPAILVVIEVALACAVFCNSIFMIGQRLTELNMPNAISQNDLVDISVRGVDPNLVSDDIPRNLASLRRIPGVIGVAATTTIPFGKGLGVDGVSAEPDSKNAPGASRYMFTQGGPTTFGLQLLKGRFFSDSEYVTSKVGATSVPDGHVVIFTQSLARRLWPGGDALGKQLWMGDTHHYTIVGIVADVARPNGSGIGRSSAYYSTFFPVGPNQALTDYIVSSTPQEREKVLHAAVAIVSALSPNAVVKGQSFKEIRDEAFANIRSMVWILVLVCVVMLVVTAFSIVGLTSFWVNQRRRQAGIRRALGATRANILHYSQTENFLLSTAGVVLGTILAFGINLYLMDHYQMDRMPWYYVPFSAITMWIIGQISVLAPAIRSSRVPPAAAIRNV